MSAVIIRLRVFITHDRFGGERFVAAYPRDRIGELIARLLVEAGIEDDPRKWELSDGDKVVFPDLTVGEILGYNRAWSNLTLRRTLPTDVSIPAPAAPASGSEPPPSGFFSSLFDVPLKNDGSESGVLAIESTERELPPEPEPEPPAPPPPLPPQVPETPPLFGVTPTMATADELLDLIRKSGVVEEAKLTNWVNAQRSRGLLPSHPKTLAEALIRDGLLTHFQAEALLQGKYKRFTLGSYKVLERLGGNTSQIYLCEHKLMRRRVAIRVLDVLKTDDASAYNLFDRQARAVAALDHPNLVRLYDIGQDENLHFAVMEFVDGTNLRDLIRKWGPLDPLRACHYIYAAAVGLQYGHENGLTHLEISPRKLHLDRIGLVKIRDIGRRRYELQYDRGHDVTRKPDENELSAADYLAPEQALDSHTVDIRADIYTLGGIFYFLLTGQSLFPEGSVAQKLIWHQTRQPKPITEFRHDVPAQIITIIDKMLAKKRDARYQTPAEVMEALAPWVVTPIPPPDEREMPQLSAAAAGPKSPAPAAATGGRGIPGLPPMAPGGGRAAPEAEQPPGSATPLPEVSREELKRTIHRKLGEALDQMDLTRVGNLSVPPITLPPGAPVASTVSAPAAPEPVQEEVFETDYEAPSDAAVEGASEIAPDAGTDLDDGAEEAASRQALPETAPSEPASGTALRKEEAPQQAPPAPVIPKPAPMAPPPTRAAPMPVPSMGMAPDREGMSYRARASGRVAPAKAKVFSTTERRATVRYYSRMNPDRVFPLLVMLTRQEVEEIVKKYVEQKATGPLTIAKDVPLEIEPVLPGCQVHPPLVRTILGNSDDVFTFHIVPHVLGEVTGARVFIRQDHKILAEIKLDMRVVQRTMVVASGLSTFVLPAASAVMRHFNVDLTPKDGSSPYLALLNFLYGQVSPLSLTLVLALVTFTLWWFTRPKGRDVFWDITTKPPAPESK